MINLRVENGALTLDLDDTYRCLSSAVLGGGLGEMRTWLNLQVDKDYDRLDPAEHLRDVARERSLPQPVVGMLTAARVEDYATSRRGVAHAVVTAGLRDPLAAAGEPMWVAPAGTINLLVVVDVPLTDAALVGAAATATEAKAGALAELDTRAVNAPGATLATGTATDALCVACPVGPFDTREPFAGPATRVGNDLARTVHAAVTESALRYHAWRRITDGEGSV